MTITVKNNQINTTFKSTEAMVSRRDLIVAKEGFGFIQFKVAANNGEFGGFEVKKNFIRQDESVLLRQSNEFAKVQSIQGERLVYKRVITVSFKEKSDFSLFRSMRHALDSNMDLCSFKSGSWVNHKNGKIVDNSKVNEICFMAYSASSVKDKTAFYIVGSRQDAIKFIDVEGTFSGIIENIKNSVALAEAGKEITRVGLNISGTRISNRKYNTVLFYGKFNGATLDGEAYMTKESLIEEYRIPCNSQDVPEIQARFNEVGIAKFKSKNVEQSLMNEILEYKLEEFGFTLSQLKAKKVLYVGASNTPSFVYVGDGGEVDLAIDENGLKTKVDLAKITARINEPINLLLMSVAKEGEAKTCKQVLEAVMYHALIMDGAVVEGEMFSFENWYNELLDEMIDQLDRAYDNVINEFDGREEQTKEDYGISIIRGIDPSNPAVSGKIISDAADRIANMINKLSFNAGGVVGAVCSDIAAAFISPEMIKANPKLQFVKAGEVIIGGNEDIVDTKGILVKMPKMYLNEHASVVAISGEEAANRVWEAKRSGAFDGIIAAEKQEEIARLIARWYISVPSGSLILPNISEMFRLIAGMDCDMDKAFILTNPLIVKVLWNKEQNLTISAKKVINKSETTSSLIARRIAEKSAKEEMRRKGAYDFDLLFEDTFERVIEHEGKIGFITFCNNTIVAMLINSLRGDDSDAREWVKAVIKKANIKSAEELKDIFTSPEEMNAEELKAAELTMTEDGVEVNERYASFIVNSINESKLTRDNLIKFLLCANKVMRLYQESNIDGAKTSYYVNMIIESCGFTAESLIPITVKCNLSGAKESRCISISRETRDFGTSVKDVLGKVQDQLCEYAREVLFPEFIKEINEKTVSKDMLLILDEVYNSIEYKSIQNELMALKGAYNMAYVVDIADQLNKDDEGNRGRLNKGALGIWNKMHKIALAAANGDETLAARMLMVCQMSTKEQGVEKARYALDPNSTNKILYTMNPAMGALAYVGSEGYEIKGKVIAGEANGTFEFIKGVSTCGNCILDNKFFGFNRTEEFNDETGERVVSYVAVKAEVMNGVATAIVHPENHKNFKNVSDELGFALVSGLKAFNKTQDTACVRVEDKVYLHHDFEKTALNAEGDVDFDAIINNADQVLEIAQTRVGLDKNNMADISDMNECEIYFVNAITTTFAVTSKGSVIAYNLDLAQ